ncbi:MAG TPA: DUF115 domain-containing protein [Candidatus Gastranaerophilales bacterium]|nr:DUF115 domain-containing protein [Candidatus Gastranaerophilales bacterium]
MFEKNIQAIKIKNPEFAEKIKGIDFDLIKDQITVAEAESQDLIIGYKGIALHSMVDPIREARAIWNKTVKSDLKKTDTQIVFGLGLGYLFKRAYLNANSRIFLIEPVLEILRFVLEHVDLSTELADERVYITDNIKDATNRLQKMYLQGDKVEFILLPAYTSLAKDTLEELSVKVINVIEGKSSDVNTIFKLAPRWMRNFIKNLPFFADFRPLGFFKDKFVDKTALIIAAGPSLVENIDKIKQNKDKFITICAAKALKTLAENDIIPDFVTFADAGGFQGQVKGVESILEKTNIILTSKSDHTAIKMKTKSKILYLPETEPFSNLFQKYSKTDPGIYKSASSISIINYFIAKTLGFNNIAFVGLDLSFPDNKLYSTGETLETTEDGFIKMEGMKSFNRTVKYTKDKNGMEIATRDDYLLFIRQFEEIFEEETSLSKVVNTSVKGAYINGMAYFGFDEFLRELPSQAINVDEMLSDSDNSVANDWNNCLKAVFNELYSQKEAINEVKEESELLINSIHKFIDIMEKETGIFLRGEKLSKLQQNVIKIRKKIMESLTLQISLQGILWEYSKNYKTDNLANKDVMLNNLKEDEKLFISAAKHSAKILTNLEESFKIMEEKTATSLIN